MPVTSVGSTPFRPREAAPFAAGTAAPPAAAPGEGVGHGVTRLKARPSGFGADPGFVPGVPPPRGETAGAHGDHKGRIAVRYS